MVVDGSADPVRNLPEHKVDSVIKTGLMRALPGILVAYGGEVKLQICEEDVEVTLHEYGYWDVNPMDVKVSIRISAAEPSSGQSQWDRDRLSNLVADWFRHEGVEPRRCAVVVIWESTYGVSVVDGVPTKWCP